MTKDYLKDIKDEIHKEIDDYTRGKYELNDDEIDAVMPDVVEFYNNHPKDKDVYRDSNGCILLIQTPKAIMNKKGDIINAPIYYESDFGEDQYLLKDCKFRIYNRTESIGLFGTRKQWTEMGKMYDVKAFIKIQKLKLKYGKLGDLDKNKKLIILTLPKFLKRHDLNSIDDIDEKDYMIFYGANITQII